MGIPSLGKFGEQKVTVPLAVLVGLLWVGWNAKDFTVEGLDQFFVSEVEGAEITEQLDKIGDSLDSYIAKSEIREINHSLEEVGAQITETQLWIAANGENAIATARLGDLVRRRDRLTETKACLQNANVEDKETCYVE